MQAPTDAPVLEEHQTGGPPVTHQQVCDCRSLSLYVCVHISRSSNIQYVSLIWTCNMFYMQVAQDEYIVSGSIPSHAEVESQPRPQITYKFVCFFAVSTDETYPSSLAMGITNE